MPARLLNILCVCCAVLAWIPAPARQTTMLPGTVSNFELPNFNENTGVKEWELFGDKAKYINDNRVDVYGIKLNLFEGKAEASLRATIKSPEARVNPNTKISESESAIDVSAKDFDMNGKKWRWNGDKRFVEVFSDVNITVKSRSKNGGPTKLKGGYASLDYGGDSNIFVLKDNATVKNPEMSLTCDRIKLDSAKSGNGVGGIAASGNVKMSYGGRNAEAERADIFPEKETATLDGNPKIVDVATKAKLGGHRIALDRGAQKVVSFGTPKNRARAEIFHDGDDGKEQRIEIFADKITMLKKDGKNSFDFEGNVKILAEDFKAECSKLTASALDSSEGKAALEFIKGTGNVKFKNADGTATGEELEIYPEKSEIWLAGKARLENPERGTALTAATVVFIRDKNSGMALSDAKDKNSFVTVSIDESPDIGSAVGVDKKSATREPTVIKSKRLNFSRADKSSEFAFFKDVSIRSSDMDAFCQKMNVYAETDNAGTTTLKKISASDNVTVKQKGYSAEAELAAIYPRIKLKSPGEDGSKKPHKYVELSTDPSNPGRRPTVKLPPVKNIGLKDSDAASKITPTETVIKSDKQWLASSEDADRYYFQGDVTVNGTDMNASCEKIEVTMRPKRGGGQKEITQIAMTGGVKLDQQLKEVRCGRADIYADEQMIVLSDDPVVINREDNSRVSGHRIVYNKGTQSIAVEGEAPGGQTDGMNSEPSLIPDEDGDAPARPTIKLPIRQKR